MEANAPASKRVRVRQDCPHCGISLGNSSYYEHILVCGNIDDSDSAFEIPSEDDNILPTYNTPSTSSGLEGIHQYSYIIIVINQIGG